MKESDILNCAAILTAGMLAREHEHPVSPEYAASMFEEVVAAIRKNHEQMSVDDGYAM